MPVPDFSPLPPAKNMQIKKVTEILERANASYQKMKLATREAWKNKLDKGGFQNTMVLPSVDSIVGDLQVSVSQPDTPTQTPTALSGDVNLLTTSTNVSAQQAQFSNQNITLPPLPPSLPPHLLLSQPESHHDPFTSDPYTYKPFPPFQPPPGVNIRDTSVLGSSNTVEGSNSTIHFMTAGYDILPHSQAHIPSAVSTSNNLSDFNGHNRAFSGRR
ncbi:hypothetical protein BKA69DRAFT_491236 [Paraphysoderma sedebokerense]|nr:hypothetical protein BKA69DRAFT_491236 [Paraphysoderma sedebokerense]